MTEEIKINPLARNFLRIIKERPIEIIFIIILIVSWSIHINFRNDHFQEADSSGTYNIIYDFPFSTIRTIALFYPEDSFISKNTAKNILSYPIVNNVRKKYLSELDDTFLIEKLSNSSPLALFRYGMIQVVDFMNLPFPIRSFFVMGLGSTYSSGTGLIYGLFSGPETGYHDFMSRSMIISITLFHLSVLLLFLINKKLKINIFINIFTCILMLFSISIYSSGIRIGSTIWNISTEFFWIWFLIKNYNHPKILNKISLVSGLLIFFNYLILLFWASFLIQNLLCHLRENKKYPENIWGWIKKMVRTQMFSIISISLCAILFFLPGQGFRGNIDMLELPNSIYYIVLNFTSWYTHNKYTDYAQFLIGFFLIISFIFIFKKKNLPKEQILFRHIFCILLIIYVIFVCFKILSFVPTRHVLFLTPLFFILSALGLNNLFEKIILKIKNTWVIFILILFIILGFITLNIRQKDAIDLVKNLKVDKDVSFVGVYDSSYNVIHSPKNNTKIPAIFINPKLFKKGEIYLYASQVSPFKTALAEWEKEYNIRVEIIKENNKENWVFFIAYNPGWPNSRYSRPNNFYQTKFKVIDIIKK